MKALAAAAVLIAGLSAPARAGETRLARYPDIHDGRVVFTYLGDIWLAGSDGSNVQRLTVHKARDVSPRFSPDGRWIAFSSDREGDLDVYVIPTAGGAVRRLTVHSADETVLDWTPDGKGVLFTSQRGEDFMPRLYVAPIDGGLPRNAGPDMGVAGSFSPDGGRIAINRKSQAYWRKYYRGAYQSDVTVMDLVTHTFHDVARSDGVDSWPMWGRDGFIYFVSDRQGRGLTNIWRVRESGGEAERVTGFTSGDVRFPAIGGDGKAIVFEHDFSIWKLDTATGEVKPIRLEIAAETQETLTEFRDFRSTVNDYDLAPDGRRIALSVHGELFSVPTDEEGGDDLRQFTEGAARDRDVRVAPDGKSVAYVSDQSGREEIHAIAADGSGPARKLTDIDALKSSVVWSPDGKSLAFTTSDRKLYTIAADGKGLKELASSSYGPIGAPPGRPTAS